MMEILSPASNMEHIKVAIDNKANAVYGGLKKWNARNKAINFSTEEYNFLIKELHKNNLKFYLTLNILMLDEEIEEVINFLKVNELPDSFIVTDVGLIRRLHKEFPNVPLHFSTQFGCHNIDDVNYVKSLNGTRAILARELTLNEIEKIKINTDIELECFIWGSQCLSFSGLCFFGTLINGGGGNRGKCIITCRDIYSINNDKGHYLYVPDMDCINLISKLDGIDCLKLEGRRRNPKEIATILEKINNNRKSVNNVGYLFGKKIESNNLYEKINSRLKPIMLASKVKNIDFSDICIEYLNNIPIKFSQDYNNPNVMYMYTEIKKKYNINKKNVNIELTFNDKYLNELLYINHKGEGHTFNQKDSNYMIFDIRNMIKEIEKQNEEINIYKIRYQKNEQDEYYIDQSMYNEIVNYILNDCKESFMVNKTVDHKLKKIYLETQRIDVIEKYINDSFVKIIYDIATISNLKNIEEIINKYGNKIIYKLPLFNWNSDNIKIYFKLLENKEIMFTRFTQIGLCKDINFRKKYVDYTIYVWNKETLAYLKENNIDVFTASPELSYNRNKYIFNNNPIQVILCGKLPLVYTRNCFKHLYGCTNCKQTQCNIKNIRNEDKCLDFEIICNDDYRYILNKDPILNDYSKLDITDNTEFRYVTTGQNLKIINETVEELKKKDYYNKLKTNDYWKNSYQCNLLVGKD